MPAPPMMEDLPDALALRHSRRSRCQPRAMVGAALIGGSAHETVTLAPQSENSLKGEAKNPIPAGATITLTIKTAEGKSGQAKFKK
jgi:hypothetical protein